MREILFRGKRIDNGEWVYGSFCMDAIEQKKGLCGIDGFIRLFDFDNNKMQMCEVDRDTVGQYTGLTDKNGKKIFEGDIIRELDGSMDGIPREVCWDETCMNFNCPLIRKHWAYGYNACGLWLMQSKNIEVIGNIHDNPELLEVDNG